MSDKHSGEREIESGMTWRDIARQARETKINPPVRKSVSYKDVKLKSDGTMLTRWR